MCITSHRIASHRIASICMGITAGSWERTCIRMHVCMNALTRLRVAWQGDGRSNAGLLVVFAIDLFPDWRSQSGGGVHTYMHTLVGLRGPSLTALGLSVCSFWGGWLSSWRNLEG
ncbi:hypothetical protein L209DRAFT_759080 [Thermothelomyces heterothallicus CBS 203.75]